MGRVSAEQRRRDLTAAAIEVLIEGGPSAVTTRRVAERAGAPLGSVHYAFRGKDELLEAAAREVLGAFAAAVAEQVRPELGVRQAVGDILAGYWRWLRAAEGLALAFVETFVAMLRTGAAGPTFTAVHTLVLDVLRQAAAHDEEPRRTPLEELARLVLIAADGLTLVHLVTRDQENTEQDLQRLIAAVQSVL